MAAELFDTAVAGHVGNDVQKSFSGLSEKGLLRSYLGFFRLGVIL